MERAFKVVTLVKQNLILTVEDSSVCFKRQKIKLLNISEFGLKEDYLKLSLITLHELVMNWILKKVVGDTRVNKLRWHFIVRPRSHSKIGVL
ncbi:MAG: hypothetical protein EZS28_032761 [Streblomastix strix]|uniref:Uncharacterized protein n=1 Tax=Streblomastix strix TaxID=222440 RepID=A0A5J4UN47_9EUKA|nr:MAG: hypothetical protein EZS28_032761 [Streblomastix strix]